jgi:hypothetical protein
MNDQISKKKSLPWNWVRTEKGNAVRLVKEKRVIPEAPSSSTYTFCNIVILAIKKAKELKGSVEREMGYLDPFSPKAMKMAKVTDVLGYQMIKLANLGYAISRNLDEYQGRTVDDFINIYRQDKREPVEYKRKSLECIVREFETLQDLMATQAGFYTNSDRVQEKVLNDLEEIYNEMTKGLILLHSIHE